MSEDAHETSNVYTTKTCNQCGLIGDCLSDLIGCWVCIDCEKNPISTANKEYERGYQRNPGINPYQVEDVRYADFESGKQDYIKDKLGL